jgi:hypothetical protein
MMRPATRTITTTPGASMVRTSVRPRRRIQEVVQNPRRTFNGKLAEPYDGIGQYVLVAIAGSSVAGAYKARVASGDFGTGMYYPAGTPVSIFSYRGQIEILSLGLRPDGGLPPDADS